MLLMSLVLATDFMHEHCQTDSLPDLRASQED